MARPKKFDYDSDDFYDEILALSMQGYGDAEIADLLSERFGESLDPTTFSCMKKGKYREWTEEENERRSVRINKVLTRGRRKINGIIVKGRYLKLALGGIKVKSKSIVTHKMRVDGVETDDEEIQTTETETELPPNLQALSTWLYHHDEEWRKKEVSKVDITTNGKDMVAPPSVNVQVVTNDPNLLELQDKSITLKQHEDE